VLHAFITLVLICFFPLLVQSKCLDENKVKNQYIIKVNRRELSSSKLSSTVPNFKIKSTLRSIRSVNALTSSKLVQNLETLVIETDRPEEIQKVFEPEFIQQDCYVDIFSLSSDPFSVYQNWYLKSLNADKNFNLTREQDVVVAVVDTGVEIQHEDLRDNIWINTLEANGQTGVDDDGNGYIDDIYGYDVADNDNDPVPTRQDFYLDFDHGTHVAGLIGASYDNRLGIIGIGRNQVKIMAVKGFKSQDRTPISDLLKGIYYAVDNGAHIINASWGATKPAEQAEIDAINYALSREVLVVAAAGNDTEPASWVTPASIPGVVTIGSLNSRDQLSTFSNYGASVNFVAPGGDGSERRNEFILSSVIEDDYDELRGTSMSAPLISGSLALLMSQRRDLTPYMALKAINSTADELRLRPYIGRGEQIYRKVNLDRALTYVQETQNISKLDPRLLTINTNSETEGSLEIGSSLQTSGSGGCGLQSKEATVSGSQGHSLAVTLLVIFPSFLTFLIRIFRRKE